MLVGHTEFGIICDIRNGWRIYRQVNIIIMLVHTNHLISLVYRTIGWTTYNYLQYCEHMNTANNKYAYSLHENTLWRPNYNIAIHTKYQRQHGSSTERVCPICAKPKGKLVLPAIWLAENVSVLCWRDSWTGFTCFSPDLYLFLPADRPKKDTERETSRVCESILPWDLGSYKAESHQV